MKKFFWMVAAATALFASCAKDATTDVLPAPEATEDFTATFDMSRAELDGTVVKWNDGDLITIFTKTNHNRQYKANSLTEDDRSAKFSYTNVFTQGDGSAISANYAVYPYDEEATISGDVITTKINAEQVFDKTKVDLSNSLMVAKSSDLTLSFVNAGGLLRFKVAKENLPDVYTLKSINVTSQNNNLAGKVTIDTGAGSKAVVLDDSNASNSVTLTNIDATIEQEAGMFYLALPATSFEAEDLTLTFTFEMNGAEWKKVITLPAFELKQNAIKTISYTIKAEDEFTGLTPETEELVSVSSSEELEEAIKNAAPSVPTLIQLPAGEFELNTNIDSKKNITIVGTEATRSTGTILKAQVMVTGKLTLKNLTVAGPFKKSGDVSQFSKTAISLQNAGKVVAENVTFDMENCINDATAISAWWSTQDGANITVKHCVFNCYGQRPIRSDASVTVEDCTFNDPYRYAVQLTSKSSTMDPEVRGVMNFFRNTIIAGTTTTKPVYGVQLEGATYGCYDLTINGAENVIDLGSTGKESAMYYCECGKVDHASIVWNTDLQPVHEEIVTVASQAEFTAALKGTFKTIYLKAGEYELGAATIAPTNVSIIGLDKEASIVKISKSLYYYGSLSLDNLTVQVPTNLAYNEHDFAYIHHAANFTMTNCNSNGRIRLNVYKGLISDCDFNVTTSSGFDGYAIYYYGKTNSTVEVNNSTFQTAGKGIVMYSEGVMVYNLKVNGCEFVSSNPDTDKAAIQMHTEHGISGTLEINESSATGFLAVNDGLWNELMNNGSGTLTDNFDITVDGVQVH